MILRFVCCVVAISFIACEQEDADAEALIKKADAVSAKVEETEISGDIAVLQIKTFLSRYTIIRASLKLITIRITLTESNNLDMIPKFSTGVEDEASLSRRYAKELVNSLDLDNEVLQIKVDIDNFFRDREALRKKFSVNPETAALFQAADNYLVATFDLEEAEEALSKATAEGRFDEIRELHRIKTEAERQEQDAKSKWERMARELERSRVAPAKHAEMPPMK